MRTFVITSFMLLLGGCEFPGPGSQDFVAPLPHGYDLVRSSAHQITVFGAKEIPPKVVELDHDDHFIIAKQNHLRRRSPNNPNDNYEEPDPGVFSYWIVDMLKPELVGPLTEQEFLAKREELGVPQSLTLHDVYDYRP